MGTELKDTIAKAANEFTANIIAIFAEAFQSTASGLSSARATPSPSTRRAPTPAKAAAPAAVKAAKPGRPAKAAKPQPAKKPQAGQRVRRSEADLAKTGEQVIKLLQKNKSGMRIEQINKELGTETKELMRPILKLLEEGKIRKAGERRATTYFAS